MDGELAETLARRLVVRQNTDGGWPAAASGRSATEPTAWALRALTAMDTRIDAAVIDQPRASATEWLRERQKPSGAWPVSDLVAASGFSTAVAGLALVATGEGTLIERAEEAARWLLAHPGKQVSWRTRLWLRWNPRQNPLEIDLRLRGWPWQEGMWGWVEPTAVSLLLVRALRGRIDEDSLDAAIADGEALLRDRTCPGGGWNHGLGRSHEEDLWPYPDTTAFALLALGPGGTDATLTQGRAALDRMLAEPVSRLTTALGIIVAEESGTDSGSLRARLVQQWREDFPEPTTRATAISLLACIDARLADPGAPDEVKRGIQ
ncbi:MAG: terpene cyclase/mutase family protein [Gemmatimonadota bacterium]